MDIREWLVNQVRHRGRAKVDIEDTKPVIALLVKDDGTVIQWPLSSTFVPKVDSSPGMLEAKGEPILATNAQVQVTAGERWEIWGIQASMICDINAANRVFNVYVSEPALVALPNASMSFESSSITLTASENGQLYFPISTAHWANTHGTLARVADENPLPMTLEEASVIVAASTLKQVGDQIRLRVKYRKVA